MAEAIIDSLVIDISSKSNNASKDIINLSNALNTLKGSAKLTSVNNNLNKLSAALSTLSKSSKSVANITKIGDSVANLSKIGNMKNLTSAARGLKNIVEVSSKLNDKEISAFAQQMKKLSDALAPLATRLNSVSTAFSKLPSNITKAAKATNSYNASTTKANKTNGLLSGGITGILSKFGLYAGVWQTLRSVIGTAINETNSYIENMNMFSVSMGEYADEATKYAEQVQSLMGIDMSEWVRNQAIFMNMASGFGIARDAAYQMSKGLTELAYDISSFYNTPIEEAFIRLQSGIAGEIEPVRRWGIALDQVSMQQWMLRNGINASVASLDQGSKAMIRYNMIVESMANNGAIGDMARTLQSPANAIRILSQQITQLARAIGSILIPILSAVLPYIQAFVKALTLAISALAGLFGIDWKPLDFSTSVSGLGGVSSAAGDAADAVGSVGDAASGAAKKAKELKDATMGFDELNIISPPESTAGSGGGGGGAGGGGGGGLDLGLDPSSVWDDAIFDQINSKVDALVPKMKILLGVIAAIGGAMLAWKIGNALYDAFQYMQALKLAAQGFPNLAKAMFDEGELSKGQSRAIGAVSAVSNAVNSAKVKFALFAPAVANALSAASSQIIAFGGTMKMHIVSAATTAATSLSLMGKRVVTSFTAMSTAALAAIKPYVPLIAVVAALSAAIVYLWKTDEDFRNTMIECGNEIKAAFMPVLENLKTAFMEIVQALAPAIGELGKAFGELVTAISPLAGDILTMLAQSVGQILTQLAPLIGNILTQLAPLLAQIVPLIGQVVTYIVSNLSSVLPTIISAISGFISVVAPAITSFLTSVLPLIMNIVSFIMQNVVPILTDIVVFVLNMVSGIIEAITPIISFVANIIAKVIEFIASFVSTAAEKIIQFKDKVVEIWNKIKEIAQNVWNAIKDFIGTVIEKIKNVITPIVEFFRSVWNKAKEIVSNVWNGIKNTISNVIEGIKKVIDAIVTPVRNTFNKVKNIVLDVFEKVQGAWDGFKGFVGGVVDGIRGAFDDVVDFFKSIVNAVIKGINGAIGLINKIPGVEISKIDYLANGTDNWQGGFAVMNEYGRGELVNLPNGAQVIPHDVSMEYARESARLNSTPTVVENNYYSMNQDNDAEQLAVLREQNSLLRAILDKDTSVILDGKNLTRAVEKRQANRGAVLMPGGVKYGY